MKTLSLTVSSFASISLSHCFSLLSAFLYSKPFRNNKMHCEIIDRYFNVFFVEIQLKKGNLKSVPWALEFGRRNRYTGLTNGLNTSLKLTPVKRCEHFVYWNRKLKKELLKWGSEFRSYKIELQNRVMQNEVSLRVTDLKLKNKKFHFELLTWSWKIKNLTFEFLGRYRKEGTTRRGNFCLVIFVIAGSLVIIPLFDRVNNLLSV